MQCGGRGEDRSRGRGLGRSRGNLIPAEVLRARGTPARKHYGLVF